MRRRFETGFAAALAAAALAATAAHAQSGQLSVEMDKARTLSLAEPAATIIIGNPMVADAAIQDRRMLILTGKSYGQTNMIVLNADGETILDADLTVTPAESPQVSLVQLHRGSERTSYVCAYGGQCQGQPMIGDSGTAYDTLMQQRAAQISASETQAQASGGGR